MRAVLEPAVTEAQRVRRWRAAELERAGFDVEAADLLAQCLYVDLRVACGMLADGCDQLMALRILL